MMHFRWRYETLGGHVLVRVFVGASVDATHANAGHLVLRESEWSALRDSLDGHDSLIDDAGQQTHVVHEVV